MLKCFISGTFPLYSFTRTFCRYEFFVVIRDRSVLEHMAAKSSNFQEQLLLYAEVIASRFRQNRRQIRECVNLDALEPHMRERFMLTSEDCDYLRLRDNVTLKRVDYVLECVEKRYLYVKFLESVESETTHLGHGYVKTLLQGTYYCSDDDLHKAADIRRKVESNLSRMMDIDLSSLVPLLCSQFLLTKDERTLLTAKSEVQNQDVLQFFDILKTKGPLAYLKFVHCLSRETSHLVHNELYELLCHKTDELALAVCDRPAKKTPNRLVMEGALVKEKYKQLFARIKEDLYNGDWEAMKRGVDECVHSKIPEVCVVGLLENAFSWVVRCNDTKVLKIIDEAKELCKTKLSGSNAVFLKARAEYILSGMYRYKQNDKALECAEKAMALLFNAEPGEDSAHANYNHACALVAKCNPSDAAQIMDEFAFAVDVGLHTQAAPCSSNKWSRIVADKSLIQQAMLLLDSNKNVSGITDKSRQENIAKASSSLSELNLHSLSNRIKWLYYLAESELHTQKEEADCANKAAIDARTLATECSFVCLLHLVNAKVHSLSRTYKL